MAKKKKNTKRNRRIKNFIAALIFILGLSVLLYPTFSRWYYRIEANEQIADFKREVSNLNQEEIDERLELAHAFNDALVEGDLVDPYSEEQKEAGIAEYARMLEVNEKIGTIQIPSIDVNIPIYAGTTENVLQKGAGHLEGTSLPVGGNSTHTVITAHTGLPSAKLFTDLNKMEIGDKFYITNIGETLAYQVNQILVVEPSNFSDLLVSPGHDYATLLTCTPIMVNSHRLLVRGHRVPYVPAVEERIIAENQASFLYRYLFYGAIALVVLLFFILLSLRKKKKKAERRYRALLRKQKALEEEQRIDAMLNDPNLLVVDLRKPSDE